MMTLWRQIGRFNQQLANHKGIALNTILRFGSSNAGTGKTPVSRRSGTGIVSTDVWKYATVRVVLDPLGISKDMWESGWRVRCQMKGSLERLTINLRLFEDWGMRPQGRKMLLLKSPNATVGSVLTLQKKLDWLIEGLDFDKANALRVLEGCPSVLGYSIENNLRPFVQRLLAGGVSKTQLQKTVITYPMILSKSRKFTGMLAQFRTAFGFSEADFMKTVIVLPQVIGYSVKLKVEPLVKYLEDLGVSRCGACGLLRKSPKLLSFSLNESILPTIEKFRRLGLNDERLCLLIPKAPELLTRDFNCTVLPKIQWLRTELGMSQKEAVLILTGFPCAFKKRIETWEEICMSLQSLGVSVQLTAGLLRSSPNILGQNPENLRYRFSYAQNVLKKSTSEVLACPRFLSSSIERTVKVRVENLVSRGIDPTQKPLSLFCASQDRFRRMSKSGEDVTNSEKEPETSEIHRSERVLGNQ